MIELGHRERFLRSVRGEDLDRVPVFFRAEEVIRRKIREVHGLNDDSDMIKMYGADAIQCPLPIDRTYIKESTEENHFFDIYGNELRSVQYGEVWSNTVVKPLLGDAKSVADVDNAEFTDPGVVDIKECEKHAVQAYESGLAIYGGMWASLFTASRSIVGEENFLISLYENPEMIKRVIERLADFFIACNEIYFSKCAKYLDVFYFGSDFGTQASMFISKDMFAEFFKPAMKRIVEHAKGFELLAMYHTCGAVEPIIEDLVDCGIDILDPVQVSAEGMAPDSLAAKYKGKICFHGGISTQTTLPFGTAEQVKEEVLHAIDAFGPKGYIMAPDQDMIGDIPIENIDAMFRTASEYKLC